ncbi:MAG: hypothetical protein INQ03_20795 [Candidatus Heimdallarchaeota archaeon]|nr:hypothetical protein [Candidatus Heimdallarchaeota archaeon]
MSTSSQPDIIKIIGKGYTTQFSRGLLAHTLKSRGINLDDGYRIARKVHHKLVAENITEINESDLRAMIKDIAFVITGEKIDRRFNLIEVWHDSGIPLVILLSGSRGLGKAELGSMLASRFAIPNIVTTSIVSKILRKMITPDLAPELHTKSYLAYKKLRPIYSILYDKVLIGYEEHAKFTAEAVEALVKRGINESQSLIIRGVHLPPRFLSEQLLSHPSIIYITLTIPDEDLHFERYKELYADHDRAYRQKHFPAIRKIHNYLVEQAAMRNYMVVDCTNVKDAMDEIEKIVFNRLDKMFKDGNVNYMFKSYDEAVLNS